MSFPRLRLRSATSLRWCAARFFWRTLCFAACETSFLRSSCMHTRSAPRPNTNIATPPRSRRGSTCAQTTSVHSRTRSWRRRSRGCSPPTTRSRRRTWPGERRCMQCSMHGGAWAAAACAACAWAAVACACACAWACPGTADLTAPHRTHAYADST